MLFIRVDLNICFSILAGTDNSVLENYINSWHSLELIDLKMQELKQNKSYKKREIDYTHYMIHNTSNERRSLSLSLSHTHTFTLSHKSIAIAAGTWHECAYSFFISDLQHINLSGIVI